MATSKKGETSIKRVGKKKKRQNLTPILKLERQYVELKKSRNANTFHDLCISQRRCLLQIIPQNGTTVVKPLKKSSK